MNIYIYIVYAWEIWKSIYKSLAVASIARDDPSPLTGMHRDHNALPSQTDRRTLTSYHKREMYILHLALKTLSQAGTPSCGALMSQNFVLLRLCFQVFLNWYRPDAILQKFACNRRQSQGFYTKKLRRWSVCRGACTFPSIGAPFPVWRSGDSVK